MTKFSSDFRNGIAQLNIWGENTDINEYYVEFIDLNTNIKEYSSILKVNYWAKLENIINKNILIRVSLNDETLYERIQNQIYNRVYIKFGSKALGDTVAWIPYVEEYRKLNNIDVILYTAHNYLFDKAYPNIIFTDELDPNKISDVDKKFRIDYGPELYRVNGESASHQWYDENKFFDNYIPYFDYRKCTLQHIAPMILGFPKPYQEIKPEINIPDEKPKIKTKYVVIAMQSTAQLKYWNNPFGWERLFSFLERNGYKIVIIDRYKNFGVPGHYNQAPKNKSLIDKTGNRPLSERITDIKYADMVITISSGLAWVAWAVGTPVVMISGFTKPWNEFNCVRIHNSTVCNGCWNDPEITYDASNWLFCPKNLDFICSKAIQPRDVIDAIKPLLK